MKYTQLAKYFCFYCAGLLSFKSYLAPIFCIPFLFSNPLSVIFFFSLGFLIMKYFNVTFIILTGVVSNISYNRILITNNISVTPIYTRNISKFKIGQKVKIGCYNNKSYYKLVKIYYVKEGEKQFIHKVREFVSERLNVSQYAEFCRSVVLGERMVSDVNSFRIAGTYHLLAISGLHFSIFMRFIKKCLIKLFSLSFYLSYNLPVQEIVNIFVIILSFGYLYIIFAPFSAIKAFILSSSYLLIHNRLSRRKLLLIIAFGILLINCNAIFDWSFALSFLATFAINYGSGFIAFFLLGYIPTVSLSSILINALVIPLFSILLPIIFMMIFIPQLHYIVDITIWTIYQLNKIIFFQVDFSKLLFCYYFLLGLYIIYPDSKYIQYSFIFFLFFTCIYNLF